MDPRVFRATLLLLALTGAACADARTPAMFVARDSAGIQIRESAAPAWTSRTAWTVDPEPEVVIGVREGDERYLLAEVRGARRLDDGRIVVLDRLTQRLRVYGPDGTHIRDIGGEGEGPGEFRSLNSVEVRGDTLLAYSYFPPSLTVFTADGALLGTRAITPTGAGAGKAILALGFLARAGYGLGTTSSAQERDDITPGLNRLPRSLFRFRLDGGEFVELSVYPGPEESIELLPSRIRFSPYAFGKTTVVGATAQEILVAESGRAEIRIHDADYDLRRIVRFDRPPAASTAEAFDRWVEDRIAFFDLSADDAETLRRELQGVEYAPTMPVLTSIRADAIGNLWVENWAGSEYRPGDFTVLEPEGRWLGTVTLPVGRAPQTTIFDPWIEIGGDYVLGVWKDAYDVDQVRLYRLRKPG